MRFRQLIGVTIYAMSLTPIMAKADAAAEMARKAQDPLGNVRAIMTDNTVAFGGGPEDDTTYGFQIQPVYAIENDTNFNMLARAVIPIVGVDPGVIIPAIGTDPRPDKGNKWGLSDTIVQYFFSPKSTKGYKWGIGPQVSLRTRTSERQAGVGWGGGVAAVIFGSIGSWALGSVAFQHWGQNDYSLLSVQPIAMYNFKALTGAYLGYSNSIAYNWKASSGEKLTLPLGLTFGRTLLLGNGDGLGLSIGAYDLIVSPKDGPEWQFKFGISYFFN